MSKYEPEKHPLWSSFIPWAENRGMDVERGVEWQEWWECFLAGADAERSGCAKAAREAEPVNGYGTDTPTNRVWFDGFQEGKRRADMAIYDREKQS